MKYIDLHVHTTASDGTYSPSDILRLGKNIGLEAIAITDHETMNGLDEAHRVEKIYNIEIINGIEISTEWEGTELHLLGYLFDHLSEDLQKVINRLKEGRERRNEEIAGLLKRDGIPIEIEQLRKDSKTRIIGRPYFAKILVKCGLAQGISDAFQKYLTPGKPYYVKRVYPDANTCIKALIDSGGVPVLAHPLKYKFSNEKLYTCIQELCGYGLCGIECMYSGYQKAQIDSLSKMAKYLNLCCTGGSDFHGQNKPGIQLGYGYGNLRVPYSYLEQLKKIKWGM